LLLATTATVADLAGVPAPLTATATTTCCLSTSPAATSRPCPDDAVLVQHFARLYLPANSTSRTSVRVSAVTFAVRFCSTSA
jgi:hypothetical protein